MAEDLRGWLKKVEAMGELQVLEGADWDLDLACRTALDWARWREAPALVFDNIKGYPAGYRVLTNSLMTPSRLSMTLGLPLGLTDRERVEVMRDKMAQWHTDMSKFSPVTVKTGPIMENVASGKDVDLFKFPAPRWHEHDGGRFIGTGHAVITRDPDTGEVNLGCYRVQIHDRKTTGIYIEQGKHGWSDMKKYHEKGLPCPVALSIGHHPLVFAVAALSLQRRADAKSHEYEFMGAIRGEPMQVIEEEITGLPIPADAEIVLVGWAPPGKGRTEGPFGEFTGYYASKEMERPYIEIERVYYRNNPILHGAPPARPPHAYSYLNTLVRSTLIYHQLKNIGIPEVKGVWTHDSPGTLFIAVSIKQRYAGHAKQAGIAALDVGSRMGIGGRFVVVVDDDLDVTNTTDIIWALTTRTNPERSIEVIRDFRTASLDPMVRKPAKSFSNSCAIITACKPYDWMDEFPESIDFSQELLAKTRKKWSVKQ